MSLTDFDHRKTIESALAKAADFIRAARRDLGQNRAVDLTGLEQRIRALYDAALAAQDKTPEQMNDRIGALQADLHALSEELTNWYESNVRDQDAAQRHSAVSAYGKASDEG